MHYLHAHQIALHAEQAAVRAEGVTWEAYDRFMQDNIKVIGDESLSKVPSNLDLTPYRDFRDKEELKKMRACTVPCPDFEPRHAIHIAGLSASPCARKRGAATTETSLDRYMSISSSVDERDGTRSLRSAPPKSGVSDFFQLISRANRRSSPSAPSVPATPDNKYKPTAQSPTCEAWFFVFCGVFLVSLFFAVLVSFVAPV